MQYYNAIQILNQVIDYQYIFSFFYRIHVSNYNLACFYTRFSSKNICNILLYRRLKLIYDIDQFRNHLLTI